MFIIFITTPRFLLESVVDQLAWALHKCDWPRVTGAAEIDDAHNEFFGKCSSVDSTDYTLS